ncbi:MAG: alpha/beta hydrolase [Bacteroidota bacterium]
MRKILLLLPFLLSVNLSLGQLSYANCQLIKGPYEVGFTHYKVYDSTRTYAQEGNWDNQFTPRPMDISLWYPAKTPAHDVKRMTILNYMEVLKQEEEWAYLPNEEILNWFYYPNTAQNQVHMEETTWAYMDAEGEEGSFPVVIYAPSYQASSVENFGLGEMLASHGFLVISCPSKGAGQRWMQGGTPGDMEIQAQDLAFMVHQALSLPHADGERIASAGFSFGGIAQSLLQMRNKYIRAVVSLDGTERYRFPTLMSSPFANMTAVKVPYLHMAQKEIPEEVMEKDGLKPELNTAFLFFDSLRYSDAFSLRFHDLTHAYFSTLGVLFQTRDPRQDKSDLAIMASYALAMEYALRFLEANLKYEADAQAWLAKNTGESQGLISVAAKKAKKIPFHFKDFHELAREQSYEGLETLYDSLKVEHPSFEIPEGAINNLGLQLAFNPTTSEEGIKVFLLATRVYPNSANLFDSLAEAYLFRNNKEEAIRCFKKSLELYEDNQHAIQHLEELTSKSSREK